MCRREMLKAVAGATVAARMRPAVAAAQNEQASVRIKEGDLLVRLNDTGGTPLTPAEIVAGAMPVPAWPMDPAGRVVRSALRFNQLLLIRVDADKLASGTRARAAEGVVAYTAVCTHSGCDVDDWLAPEQLLSCSCHASVFDPKDGGRVVDGPAPRPLPALPLKVVDGKLAVAGPFTARVGFEPGV